MLRIVKRTGDKMADKKATEPIRLYEPIWLKYQLHAYNKFKKKFELHLGKENQSSKRKIGVIC